jgi:hypothetical protein
LLSREISPSVPVGFYSDFTGLHPWTGNLLTPSLVCALRGALNFPSIDFIWRSPVFGRIFSVRSSVSFSVRRQRPLPSVSHACARSPRSFPAREFVLAWFFFWSVREPRSAQQSLLAPDQVKQANFLCFVHSSQPGQAPPEASLCSFVLAQRR